MTESRLQEVAKKILGDKFDKLDDNIKEHNLDRLQDFESEFNHDISSSLDRLKDKLKDLEGIDNIYDKSGDIVKAALENLYKSYNG
ncbi:MAG: hypothetical protein NTY33_03200 [Candidatus Moranbacteria bacterium]|nr:hypothetical protein [Candidatus Moranbacteria bacterium]